MTMELWKIITLILGATGFWKLLEILVRLRTDKKVKLAEAITRVNNDQNALEISYRVTSELSRLSLLNFI